MSIEGALVLLETKLLRKLSLQWSGQVDSAEHRIQPE